MKICIRPETCNYDMERLKIYARDIGVNNLWYFPSISACYGKDGMMDSQRLTVFKDELRKGELNLVVTSETITPKILHGDYNELERVCRTILASAEASIDTLFIIFNFFEMEITSESAWRNLIEFYKRVIDTAEKAKVKIGVHGLWLPKHMIYNSESYQRLLYEVPSQYNGITLCMGCFHLAGDNVSQVVKEFGQKIFFVHVRDVIGRGNTFKEVFPGDGEVNIPKVISSLRDIKYNGLLCPEHFPKIVDEPYMGERATAMCVGYLKGLLSAQVHHQ